MIDHFTDISAPEPTDAEIEAHITSLDPVTDVPGAYIGAENLPISALQITALPPESQQVIRDKLATVTPGNRDLFERQFVEEEAKRLARGYRVKTGLGAEAPEYHREMLSIENERRLIEEEAASVRAQLELVDGYKADVDPQTGEALAIPLPTIQGDQRSALERRHEELGYKLSQTNRESEKRLKDALARDKAIIRERREALQINAEADARARADLREERVAALAAGKAKRLSSNL